MMEQQPEQELGLCTNRFRCASITDKGAKSIVEAIQVNTTLQKLDLSNNKISDDVVIAISDSLKINV